MLTRPIGSTFICKGKKYKVVECVGCGPCAFDEDTCRDYKDVRGFCSIMERSDWESAAFITVFETHKVYVVTLHENLVCAPEEIESNVVGAKSTRESAIAFIESEIEGRDKATIHRDDEGNFLYAEYENSECLSSYYVIAEVELEA